MTTKRIEGTPPLHSVSLKVWVLSLSRKLLGSSQVLVTLTHTKWLLTMQTPGEAKSQGEAKGFTQIYTNIQNHISWGVNEAHRIPGLTGSGIRTTKAKETVNNLKNSRCLECFGAEPGQERGEETLADWPWDISESERVAARLSYGVL